MERLYRPTYIKIYIHAVYMDILKVACFIMCVHVHSIGPTDRQAD